MNKKELLAALDALEMRPGRGLGQNFLLDGNLLDWTVRNSGASAGDEVLEVGPGFGALTEKLVDAGFRVTSVEFDRRLAEYLRKKFAGAENFRLIEADACRVEYDELFPGNAVYRAVANLPYAISSVFIARMLECRNRPVSMLFMLQKEMGERLSALSGTKAYGALSVRTQMCYETRIEKIVPPQVFCPPPEVDSALVSFKRRDGAALPADLEAKLSSLVRGLFTQRRKQIGKTLGQMVGREKAAAALAALGLSAELRPDRLTVADFAALTAALYADAEGKGR